MHRTVSKANSNLTGNTLCAAPSVVSSKYDGFDDDSGDIEMSFDSVSFPNTMRRRTTSYPPNSSVSKTAQVNSGSQSTTKRRNQKKNKSKKKNSTTHNSTSNTSNNSNVSRINNNDVGTPPTSNEGFTNTYFNKRSSIQGILSASVLNSNLSSMIDIYRKHIYEKNTTIIQFFTPCVIVLSISIVVELLNILISIYLVMKIDVTRTDQKCQWELLIDLSLVFSIISTSIHFVTSDLTNPTTMFMMKMISFHNETNSTTTTN